MKNYESFRSFGYIYIYIYCEDPIWFPNPTDRWTKAQKAQNNEFVENMLENWALINQTNTKVDLDDKKM